MIKGKINLRLRPIKLAFLVNPYNKSQVLEAIKLSTFLWGGLYNPIVPIPKGIPKVWKKGLFKENLKSIVEGYVDAYDPDIIVKFEDSDISRFNFDDRKIIESKEIFNVGKSSQLNIGIGINEIISQLYEDEFKFLRRDTLGFSLPQFDNKSELFLSAVFGNLEKEKLEKIKKYYDKILKLKTEDCSLENFSDFIKNNKIFLRRIGDSYLRYVRNIEALRNDYVIVVDSNNVFDVIDYWNLRAAGIKILPLPIQSLLKDSIYKDVISFISDNYYPINQNNVYNRTTVLKGRSLNKQTFDKIIEQLYSFKTQNELKNKFIVQSLHPRIWNDLYRRYDHIGYCDIESESKEIEISGDDSYISIETLYPKFSKQSFTDLGQFINEVDISLYRQDDEQYAQAIPEAGQELNNAFKTFAGVNEWRFSRNGIFYLSQHKKDFLSFSLPKSEDVFISWFKSRELNIKLSNSGLIAKQIIKRLGSIDGLRILLFEEIIKMLIDLSGSNITDLTKNKTIPFNSLLKIVKKAENKSGLFWKSSSILKVLVDKSILKVGIELQCPTCSQRSWHPLQEIDYDLNCPICFTTFSFPSNEPNKLKWTYKTVGPFGLGKEHIGVYSTLLCLYFFTKRISATTSSILSFDLVNKGFEIDLGIIRGKGYKSSEQQEIMFFECKTYNDFDKKDIERMEFIAKKFPNSVIVFATLKRELNMKEKRLLVPFVKKCRKYHENDRPINPVLILTGNDLFSYWGPPKCWENLGQKYEKFIGGRFYMYGDVFDLCDATQQIYLDMESWHEWIEKKFELNKTKA